MHIGTGLQYFPSLVFSPNHKRIHRSLYVRLSIGVPLLLSYNLCAQYLVFGEEIKIRLSLEIIISNVRIHQKLVTV